MRLPRSANAVRAYLISLVSASCSRAGQKIYEQHDTKTNEIYSCKLLACHAHAPEFCTPLQSSVKYRRILPFAFRGRSHDIALSFTIRRRLFRQYAHFAAASAIFANQQPDYYQHLSHQDYSIKHYNLNHDNNEYIMGESKMNVDVSTISGDSRPRRPYCEPSPPR